MKKVVLSEISLIHGSVDLPKGYEINREKIKNDIITSFVNKKRINKNPKAYSYEDYEVSFSKPLQWFKDYIRDNIRLEHGFTLIEKSHHGNVLHPKEQSFLRYNIDPVDLRNSPDYTLIYALDCAKESCELIIEYDDNRRKNRTWHLPMLNNHFYMFPATQKYMLTKNKSEKLNTILTITYEYI
tara:strand:- start:584 stop:1135 length:552 start_codon:yes stop_codon:yes gene_type:complete